MFNYDRWHHSFYNIITNYPQLYVNYDHHKNRGQLTIFWKKTFSPVANMTWCTILNDYMADFIIGRTKRDDIIIYFRASYFNNYSFRTYTD